MRTILITVSEFIENGGVLVLPDGRQRQLFNKHGIQFNFEPSLYTLVTNSNPGDYYVRVEYIPIYK